MARRQRPVPNRPAEWRFFTFPVAFAFSVGAFVASLLSPVAGAVSLVSLFAVSFGIAHIIGHTLRRRGLDRRIEREEEDERERRALAARAAARETGGEEPATPAARRRRRRRN